ncbi:MAG: ferric reductase-like transmembrane domain-containing protein, partial [Pseudomonadota bacterium]
MSVKYTPVQWNPNKWLYDAVMLVAVAAYLWIFIRLVPGALDHERPITPQIHNARAFGSCAFLMLTFILCLGPLARLDTRFLPLVYNRRHFGVLTVFVALTHAAFVLDWYYAFSPTPKLEGVLSSNVSFDRLLGFPFEALGIFALIVLLVMAATSHDFWLKFLTPRIWKRLHFLIYPAYVAVVAHVALGALQDQTHPFLAIVTLGSAVLVGVLHLAAALVERRRHAPAAAADWVSVAEISAFRDGFARVVTLENGDRVAVFRQEGTLSA